MSVVLMKDGLQKLQDIGINNLGHVTVHLCKSDVTPAKGDALSKYEGGGGGGSEADFSGYAAVDAGNLAGDVWDAVAFVWTMSAGTVSFTVAAGGVPNNVYCAYWKSADGKLLAAERFAGAPVVMNIFGYTIQYTPVLTNESKYP